MSWSKFSATLLCPINQEPLPKGIIVTDAQGTILEVAAADAHDPASVQFLPGLLVPGFINTHCHLELSHLQGVIPTGTGLIDFIKDIVTKREKPQEIIQEAIRRADREMTENGIVAVGDISNTTDGLATKLISAITYYSFVEMFDFMSPNWTSKAIQQYTPVYDAHRSAGLLTSAVPHAPYTVSDGLYQYIESLNGDEVTISIHNQETTDENQLFLDGGGDFPAFFSKFGVDYSHFPVTGRTAIHHALQRMDPHQRTLFVHNTLSSADDILTAQRWNEQVYWATCANANLYIENKLPHYKNFMTTGAKLTIGTDSLASNWQLSILEEIKTILHYHSWLSFPQVLRWATLNGAEALGLADRLGSLEVGKRPGILHLNTDPHEPLRLTPSARVRRLI